MVPKNTKSIATQSPAGLPSYIKTGQGRGAEGLRTEDIRMPFLQVGEPMSPACQAGQVDVGAYYHSITKESYGPTVDILVIGQKVKREWREDYNDGGAKLCESTNMLQGTQGGVDKQGNATTNCLLCVKKDWPKDPKKGEARSPECGEVGQWLVKLVGKPDVMVLGLSGTRFAAHRTLTSLVAATNSKGLDSFAMVVRLEVQQKKQGTKLWHIVVPSQAAEMPSEKDYLEAEKAYEGFGKMFKTAQVEDGGE